MFTGLGVGGGECWTYTSASRPRLITPVINPAMYTDCEMAARAFLSQVSSHWNKGRLQDSAREERKLHIRHTFRFYSILIIVLCNPHRRIGGLSSGIRCHNLTHWGLVNFGNLDHRLLKRLVIQTEPAELAAAVCITSHFTNHWSKHGHVGTWNDALDIRNPDMLSETVLNLPTPYGVTRPQWVNRHPKSNWVTHFIYLKHAVGAIWSPFCLLMTQGGNYWISADLDCIDHWLHNTVTTAPQM